MSSDRVGFIGDENSYSAQARECLAPNFEPLMLPSLDRLRERFAANDIRFAVVPLQNRIIGSIEGADQWLNGGAILLREYRLPISHCLAGLSACEDVVEVYSHPAALRQCSKFLSKQGWTQHETSNTSGAAWLVKTAQDPKVAAICSSRAAEAMKLKILQRRIEDVRNNYTIFGLFERRDSRKAR